MINQYPKPFSKFRWLTPALLFVLALLPRLPDLGRFLTADEFLWVDRSRNFLAGLTNAAWRCDTVVEKWQFAEGLACTLRTGHPGVTTMWTGSFGFVVRWLADGRPTSLHEYVAGVATNPLDATFIAPERLGTVLITSLWVVAVYWLAKRLFGGPVALISALLIALDPFHIGLSRVIHHDALSTTFMTLSALTALLYWGQRPGRRWLLVSGALGGLGFISKSPAMYLMPFIALTGLWFLPADRRQRPEISFPAQLGRTVLDGLLWFAVAAAMVFALWPAMWIIPRETIETVFFIGSKYATGGHAKGNFFLGDVSQDPGALFYPVTWLYRTTPLVLIGIIGAIVKGAAQLRHRTKNEHSAFSLQPSAFRRYLPLILFFILGYYLLMTIGEKKQDRYFLPAYPWLTFIAAYGLVAMVKYQWSILKDRFAILIGLILVINGALVALNYPYYFTYYNPLLGGINRAAQAVTIGWGEGLDLAAAYLNQKNPADPPRVASWYESTFAPFYRGPSISYSKEKGKALAGDYTVFYINQTQRRYPDDVLFDYFADRFTPEKVITLRGLDYAWIYPGRGVDHYVEDQTYTGIAALLAWQWTQGDTPLVAGQPAEFELWWEYLGKHPEERFFFRLIDGQEQVWAEGQSEPVAAENPPVDQWREGEIIMERGTLTPPPDMPPGQYRLQIGFYTQAAAVTAGELLFDLPSRESLIEVQGGAAGGFSLPSAATPLAQPLTPALTLLGGQWPAAPVKQGDTVPVELYWRIEQPLPATGQIHAALMTADNEAAQAWFNLTLSEIINPTDTVWPAGAIIRSRWQLILLPDTAPGNYRLDLIPADNLDVTLSIGQVEIVGD